MITLSVLFQVIEDCDEKQRLELQTLVSYFTTNKNWNSEVCTKRLIISSFMKKDLSIAAFYKFMHGTFLNSTQQGLNPKVLRVGYDFSLSMVISPHVKPSCFGTHLA